MENKEEMQARGPAGPRADMCGPAEDARPAETEDADAVNAAELDADGAEAAGAEDDAAGLPLRPLGGGEYVNERGVRYREVRQGVFMPVPEPPTEEELREYYARYERPHFCPWKVALNILLPLLAAAGLGVGLFFVLRAAGAGRGAGFCAGCAAGALGLYVLLRLKAVLIFAVRVYQRFAPMHVRERCHLTPTCSAYMIAALEKYGLFRGLKKGCGRLWRCRGQYGIDEP